ncbi:NYN domain-containing protein [Hyphomicrobium sp.]|uniref:LabA-like NYN domain-containing protein n=1 Tax=Hyphomicrobium sp. TaxID=82 RepID=UPI002D77B1CE|nr:NYN domain-containing protein [Hyphomicrobium sp.]HET6388297.1 NYN domain-containing protein [Hyphomicrobium sp.]
MKLYPDERTLLLIDGASFHASAKSLGFDIDFRRLLNLFRNKVRLVRAHYYTAIPQDPEYFAIRPLLDWLDYNGYFVVTKPMKELTDKSGRKKYKGNMDIELAVDAMRMANQVDHIMIFSGDGDLRNLVAALQELGKRVTVISTLKTVPPMVSDELRRQAGHFIDLADLGDEIRRIYPEVAAQRTGKKPSPAPARDLAQIEDDN